MMKELVLSALLLHSISSFAAERQIVELGVEGMTCKFCALNVKKNLSRIVGVKNAEVSLSDGKATIEIESGKNIDIPALKNKISELGFTPGKVSGGTNE